MGLTSVVQAQDSLTVTLRGYVVDRESGDRLPDVQVHVQGSHTATMTNADGRFSLGLSRIPDYLEFSTVGYSNVLITSDQFVTKGQVITKEIRAEMKPQMTMLKDVFVYSPENILNAALEHLSVNYSQQPQGYEAFYRETIRKRSNYVSVSEAVVDLYKTSYDRDPSSDMVVVRKGRSLMSQRAKDTISVHVMGGPTEALNLDLVKNREMFLSPEMLKNYQLEIETPKVINNRPQYVISFFPVRYGEDPLFRGLIYIDHETLSFTRIEYNMDMSNPDRASQAILARKPLGMRFKARGLNIVMNYHHDGQLSHFSYLRVTYLFDCDWKKRGFATHYEAISEMLVTDHYAQMARPSRRDAFRHSQVLSKQLSDFADPEFWRDYNILLPSESLEHALTRIKKSYK